MTVAGHGSVTTIVADAQLRGGIDEAVGIMSAQTYTVPVVPFSKMSVVWTDSLEGKPLIAVTPYEFAWTLYEYLNFPAGSGLVRSLHRDVLP